MDARPLITVQGLDDSDMTTDQSSTVVLPDVVTAPVSKSLERWRENPSEQMDTCPLITVQGLDDGDMATDQSSTVVLPVVMTAPVRPGIHAQISNNCAVSRIPRVGVANRIGKTRFVRQKQEMEEKLGKLNLTSEVYEKIPKEENIGSSNQRKEDQADRATRQQQLLAAIRLEVAAAQLELAAARKRAAAIELEVAAIREQCPILKKWKPDPKDPKRRSLLARLEKIKAKNEKLAKKRRAHFHV